MTTHVEINCHCLYFITLCSGGTRWPYPTAPTLPIYLCWPYPTITTTQRCAQVREPNGTQCKWGAHCAPPSWVEPIMCPGCGSHLPLPTYFTLLSDYCNNFSVRNVVHERGWVQRERIPTLEIKRRESGKEGKSGQKRPTCAGGSSMVFLVVHV